MILLRLGRFYSASSFSVPVLVHSSRNAQLFHRFNGFTQCYTRLDFTTNSDNCLFLSVLHIKRRWLDSTDAHHFVVECGIHGE